MIFFFDSGFLNEVRKYRIFVAENEILLHNAVQILSESVAARSKTKNRSRLCLQVVQLKSFELVTEPPWKDDEDVTVNEAGVTTFFPEKTHSTL